MATGTSIDVVMPQMGVSVSEGTITKWLKDVGQTIASDEALLEISTDKVDTEVPSPASGVIIEILVPEGETVAVGAVLARIGEAGAAVTPPAAPEPAPAQPAAPAEPIAAPTPPPAEVVPAAPAPVAPSTVPASTHVFVSPVVARIAAEAGIDPTTVPGTGNGGRVTKKDILAFVARGGAAVQAPAAPSVPEPVAPAASMPAAPAAPVPAAPAAVTPTEALPDVAEAEPGETLESMSAMRRGIADHMRRSLDTAAHVTSAIEVDMSRVVALRTELKDAYLRDYGVNPTYLAFIARAVVDTLRDWPWVNGELRGDKIVTRNYVNLGFAVALENGKGLIVPVVKHAEGLNLLGMAKGIADIAERARTKKLTPDDVAGGTFTITNPGGYGTFMGTPVISQPQAGILGTYALVKRPVVVEDALGQDVIAIRPMMNLSLTYDHRLVDGAYAAQFLRDLTHRLQTWTVSDY
ncbi:MAG: hypothetical protein F2663_00095 [Actinobacteria bacterium]|uniref:Unannotated protein n=1 Tax=freshwater metagenome TaxID=449393 RepID=A0A6J6N7M9_9ZZZZ|nr:hypothetical protein [Actinomycetota bacterium]